MDTLTEAWTPELPVSDEVDQAMQELADNAKKDGCGKKLESGQWWSFCGETDMGQSLPALCIECGGEFKLDSNEFEAEAMLPWFLIEQAY